MPSRITTQIGARQAPKQKPSLQLRTTWLHEFPLHPANPFTSIMYDMSHYAPPCLQTSCNADSTLRSSCGVSDSIQLPQGLQVDGYFGQGTALQESKIPQTLMAKPGSMHQRFLITCMHLHAFTATISCPNRSSSCLSFLHRCRGQACSCSRS